jgi:hypothetical protein
VPPSLFSFEELVMGKDGELRKEKRFPGTNKVGMLAWHTVLKTPQYPEGREVSTTLPLPCYSLYNIPCHKPLILPIFTIFTLPAYV